MTETQARDLLHNVERIGTVLDRVLVELRKLREEAGRDTPDAPTREDEGCLGSA